MNLYITRHGQVTPKLYTHSVDFPTGDIPLSPLGCEQARALGKKLCGRRFKIYSSPYRRTMMTAAEIAKQTGAAISPRGELREMFFNENAAKAFEGMTSAQLRENFENIDPDAVLPYPWWTTHVDDIADICKRSLPFLQEVLAQKDDILLVGHGASVYATISNLTALLHIPLLPQGVLMENFLAERNVNCNLSTVTIENGKAVRAVFFETDHLEDALVTSNTAPRQRPDSIAL